MRVAANITLVVFAAVAFGCSSSSEPAAHEATALSVVATDADRADPDEVAPVPPGDHPALRLDEVAWPTELLLVRLGVAAAHDLEALLTADTRLAPFVTEVDGLGLGTAGEAVGAVIAVGLGSEVLDDETFRRSVAASIFGDEIEVMAPVWTAASEPWLTVLWTPSGFVVVDVVDAQWRERVVGAVVSAIEQS